MIILALDTALETCSAAALDGDQDHWRVLAVRSETMARGHQERLAPLVAEVMAEAGIAFDSLDRIGVTVGPGSFTGLRVGLAFAKGLGVALGRPVVGVGTLAAMGAGTSGFAAVAVDARRDQIYLQAFRDGQPVSAPEALSAADAAQWLIDIDAAGPGLIVGSGAALLASSFPNAASDPRAGADPVWVARLAQAADQAPPAPIYLRAPDAKLPASALSA